MSTDDSKKADCKKLKPTNTPATPALVLLCGAFRSPSGALLSPSSRLWKHSNCFPRCDRLWPHVPTRETIWSQKSRGFDLYHGSPWMFQNAPLLKKSLSSVNSYIDVEWIQNKNSKCSSQHSKLTCKKFLKKSVYVNLNRLIPLNWKSSRV